MNSGIDTIVNLLWKSEIYFDKISYVIYTVPTGTVDLFTIILWPIGNKSFDAASPIDLRTALKAVRSDG